MSNAPATLSKTAWPAPCPQLRMPRPATAGQVLKSHALKPKPRPSLPPVPRFLAPDNIQPTAHNHINSCIPLRLYHKTFRTYAVQGTLAPRPSPHASWPSPSRPPFRSWWLVPWLCVGAGCSRAGCMPGCTPPPGSTTPWSRECSSGSLSTWGHVGGGQGGGCRQVSKLVGGG